MIIKLTRAKVQTFIRADPAIFGWLGHKHREQLHELVQFDLSSIELRCDERVAACFRAAALDVRKADRSARTLWAARLIEQIDESLGTPVIDMIARLGKTT